MRILVLDDSKERLKKFQGQLFQVTLDCVMTSREAIKKLSENRYDVVFLDHDLGGQIYQPSGPGSGYEVALWLHDNPENKPKQIIIHSFNLNGSQRMLSLLPEAEYHPGVWLTKMNISDKNITAGWTGEVPARPHKPNNEGSNPSPAIKTGL